MRSVSPDEDRRSDALFEQGGRGTLRPERVALGKRDRGLLATRAFRDRGHRVARPAEELLQTSPIGLDVERLDAGLAFLEGRLRHGGSHPEEDPVIERFGDEVLGSEAEFLAVVCLHDALGNVLAGERGKGARGGEFHALGDRRGADVEGAPEDEREAEDVVHLVGVVGATGRHDDVLTRIDGVGVADLGIGIGHREHDGPIGHRPHHVLADQIRTRQPEEHVGSLHGLLERAVIRLGRDLLLLGVHPVLATLVDHAPAVAEDHLLRVGAQADEHVRTRDAGCAGTGDHDAQIADLLAGELDGVDQRRGRDDGRSVLVVVEHGDVQLLLERLLDVEALRRLDVLEVDASEGRRDATHRVDELVRIRLVHLDVEDVDARELLEQDTLPLHDGLAGESTDVAESKNGRAVGDDGDQIASRRVAVREIGILLDLEAGDRDAGRVGEGQLVLGRQALGRDDLDLPGTGELVVLERLSLKVGGVLAHGLCSYSRGRGPAAAQARHGPRRGRKVNPTLCAREDLGVRGFLPPA